MRTSSVWYQGWSGLGKIGEQLSFVHIPYTNLCLGDLISNQQWNMARLLTLIPPTVVERFSQVEPRLELGGRDGWTWQVSNSRVYTVRDGYS